MESSLLNVFSDISKNYAIDYDELIKKYSAKLKNISDEYEDPEIHTRCKGRNKNHKRCSKAKKENSEYCSIHYNQYKEKDNEFVLTDEMNKIKPSQTHKEESSLNIIETSKKKGILPEKIKKFLYEDTKYYINKNDWVYEMDQINESIITDIPIGKLFSGKLLRLNLDDI
jgi:hypothetical protein